MGYYIIVELFSTFNLFFSFIFLVSRSHRCQRCKSEGRDELGCSNVLRQERPAMIDTRTLRFGIRRLSFINARSFVRQKGLLHCCVGSTGRQTNAKDQLGLMELTDSARCEEPRVTSSTDSRFFREIQIYPTDRHNCKYKAKDALSTAHRSRIFREWVRCALITHCFARCAEIPSQPRFHV